MHILYNIAGFYRPAGMERVLSDKANWLAAHGHRVTIITTEQKGRPAAFQLDPRIEMRDLAIGYEDNNGSGLLDKLIHYPGKQRRHLKALKRTLFELKPDIAISMFCNEVNILPRIKDGSHKLLEVHFSRFKRLQYGRKGLWAKADRLRSRQDERLVRKYERFVVLTLQDKEYWGAAETTCVIPNPVHFKPEKAASLDNRTVIAVGRYTYQKGLERLIDAWGRIKEKNGWTLKLAGDGELREDLERQIYSLRLEASVTLGRSETDMDGVYKNASILALPSRYEGLPMALLESQVFGVPGVAFDCKCGPREIITDGENGILVPEGDVQALAAGLESLMKDDALRKRLGENAFRNSSRWDMDTIMKRWASLFEEIL